MSRNTILGRERKASDSPCFWGYLGCVGEWEEQSREKLLMIYEDWWGWGFSKCRGLRQELGPCSGNPGMSTSMLVSRCSQLPRQDTH